MCGIAGAFGATAAPTGPATAVAAMLDVLGHRGPDAHALWTDPSLPVALGHTRLSIIDLSPDGRQPMAASGSERLVVSFNGEIYNHAALRAELRDGYAFRTRTDTEVLLAAYARWGVACLDRLHGMFAFLLWDGPRARLLAARDRFGEKPLYYHEAPDGTLLVASEIKALHRAGVRAAPDEATWATYLARGASDESDASFWADVRQLRPGHALTWTPPAAGERSRPRIARWYDLAARVGEEYDARGDGEVREEYEALLAESIRLRCVADVPVAVSVSGGLDSSLLLAHTAATERVAPMTALTFVTGDPAYDELPWVRAMTCHTGHPLVVCPLTAAEVPALAASVQAGQDEPFGGLPTLAYTRVFARARALSIPVLLDGQGADEPWAGYDYYRTADGDAAAAPVQGTREPATRPAALRPAFRALARPAPEIRAFPDRLRNLQYRDLYHGKLSRALRFNDRASMQWSIELRAPFLEHRLVELAMRQPPARTIGDGEGKRLLRAIADRWVPRTLAMAPKRPVQTPQREWLRGPLRAWAQEVIARALVVDGAHGPWLDPRAVRTEWAHFCAGGGDNSVFVWQWLSVGLLLGGGATAHAAPPRASSARRVEEASWLPA